MRFTLLILSLVCFNYSYVLFSQKVIFEETIDHTNPIYLENKFYTPDRIKHHDCKNHYKFDKLQNFDVSRLEIRNYDVQSYQLELDWYAPLSSKDIQGKGRSFKASITIELEMLEDADSIEIDALELQIDSILFQDIKYSDYKYNDTLLSIFYKFKESSSYSFTIHYQYIAEINSGFYLYNNLGGPDSNQNKRQRIAFTQNEPEDARRWFPCNDRPYDKALSTVKLRVPKQMEGLSNGILIDTFEDEVSKTYIWENKHPITTYLINAVASEYNYDEYTVINPEDGRNIPIRYHYWPHDTAYGGNIAKEAYSNAHRSFEELMPYFGDYPFDKYYAAACDPYPVGGMEHQGNMTFDRNWLQNRSYNGFAHELAHHWLGNLVTCATWNDIWINEGGATFSEALASGDYYYNILLMYRSWLFESDGVDIYKIYGNKANEIFGPAYSVSYWKAGWVLHMLKDIMGEENFYRALRRVFKEYAYQSIETKDYIRIFKEEAGNTEIDLDIFFHQWLNEIGYPVYNIEHSFAGEENGQFRTDVVLRQVQSELKDNFHDVYQAKLGVFLFESVEEGIGEYREIINTKKEQSFSLYSDFEPQSAVLSVRYTLLDVRSSIASVETHNDISDETIIYPNPANTEDYILIKISEKFALKDFDKKVHVRLSDITGREIQSSRKEIRGNKVSIYIRNLVPGLYSLTLYNQDMTITKKLIIQ